MMTSTLHEILRTDARRANNSGRRAEEIERRSIASVSDLVEVAWMLQAAELYKLQRRQNK